ncbi:MAG: hypothetical protein REI11_14720 [Patulibacter sp.]|nr:hypothetical protein [Patulibacter sp.]
MPKKINASTPSTGTLVVPTPAETRQALFSEIERPGAPIRWSFLQAWGGKRPPGPARHFVHERRLFALQLYLLVHLLALGKPWDAPTMPNEAWGRALDKITAGAEATVSRSFGWLESKQLLKIDRTHQIRTAYLLREDGSGAAYKRRKGKYFTLPNDFFLEGHHNELSLNATFSLLVALKHSVYRPWFKLVLEEGADWYGVSPDTLRRGLRELAANGFIESELRQERDVRARYGVTRRHYYHLLGPYEWTTASEAAMEGEEVDDAAAA